MFFTECFIWYGSAHTYGKKVQSAPKTCIYVFNPVFLALVNEDEILKTLLGRICLADIEMEKGHHRSSVNGLSLCCLKLKSPVTAQHGFLILSWSWAVCPAFCVYCSSLTFFKVLFSSSVMRRFVDVMKEIRVLLCPQRDRVRWR